MKTTLLNTLALFSLCAGLTVALGACTGPDARIKDKGEGDVIDVRKGGIPVYERLIKDASESMLAAPSVAGIDSSAGKKRIAFVGIDNQSAEAGADNLKDAEVRLEAIFVNSGKFTVISRSLVNAALAETGIRDVASLQLRGPSERFRNELRSSNQEPHYFLSGILTTSTSQGSSVKQRDYKLSLQLVDAMTSEVVAMIVSDTVGKEYD